MSDKRSASTPPGGTLLPAYNPDAPLPRTGDPFMDQVLGRLDDIYANLISPHGRLSRLEGELCEVKGLLQAYIWLHQLETMAPPTTTIDAIVMIVEDERILQTTLVRLLGHYGAKTYAVANAVEARAILHREEVNVAIVDLRLGTENGFDIACWILRDYPRTGVLMITGLITEADDARAAELGIKIMQKPFNNHELVDAINEAYASASEPPPAPAA